MSRLDATVNRIYHIIQTHWTQQTHKYAMMNQSVHDNPIIMTRYPHKYIIRIDLTPATYTGLVFSILITLSAWILAIRWVLASYHSGFEAETWNLLRPIDLMAYSLAAYQYLVYDLNTKEHRWSVMRGSTETILHEHPVWEGTMNLLGLVTNNAQQRPEAVVYAQPKPEPEPDISVVSPFDTVVGKVGQRQAPEVTVEQRSGGSSEVERRVNTSSDVERGV